MITFDTVSKVFPNGYVGLDEVSFEIDPGTLTFIQGESGAGKTTLMRLMIRELMPTEGEIFIDGESITRLPMRKIPYLRRKVAVVFQDFKLIPERTVAENVDLVLEISGMPHRQRAQRIDEVLSLVELADRAKLFPVQLSGGELQRIAFARALATTPSVIFADEPTGNLDPKTSADIGELLKKIVDMGTTVLVATHDQSLMNQHKTRVLTLNQGKIVDDTGHKKSKKSSHKKSDDKSESSSDETSENSDTQESTPQDQS
jgi:cell division transport system ATP-binding protein